MTDDASRRAVLTTGAVLLSGGLAGCTSSDGPAGETTTPGDGGRTDTAAGSPSDGGGDGASGTEDDTSGTDAAADSLRARRVASGFTSPVGLEIPQPGRRFVVDQLGRVYLQDGDGLREEPFLDVEDRMVPVGGYSEQGLLGLAFHPDYGENGRLFVRYSAPPREWTPDGYSHTFVLSEFSADPDASTADPDSERVLLEVAQPQANHNAGAVAFGPDGSLYVATGDGGRANDQGEGHVEDWYDAVDGGNGQDVTENLLGSILRIDVDGEAEASPSDGPGARDYAVPADNPLVGEDGLNEQFAWGFRNPWRLSFGPDGRLFVADVGQSAYEEVNVVERGGNYGWNVREGTGCFRADDCPTEAPGGESLVDPVIEYPHSDAAVSGVSVIGGYLYDGEAMPAFEGEYLFADWQARGRLFAASERDDGLWETRVVDVGSDAEFGPNVLSFGRDTNGELFVCTTAERGVVGDSGAVFRLAAAE